MKRVMAWLAIVILGFMYLVTLMVAIFSKENTMEYVVASIYITVVVAVLGWALMMFNNIVNKNKDQELDRALKFKLEMKEEKERILKEKAEKEAAEKTAETVEQATEETVEKAAETAEQATEETVEKVD